MSKNLLGAAGAVAVAAALAVGALAAPAQAASIDRTDPSDVAHGVDLRAVRVVNGDRALRIVLTHADLRRSPKSGAGGAVYIDTDPNDRGPELVFVGGYFEGTDYQLLHTEGFGHKRWGAPAEGSYEMTVDYAKEQVRMRMSRHVLGRPGTVRVAVRVSGARRDGTSTGLVDWLGEPRSFTPWVARG
jgi:opacity protein-like surface antigen